MNLIIQEYIKKYPKKIIDLFCTLRQIILDNIDGVEETMWAKLPSYYKYEAFIRLIPFNDHINIEASAINRHKDELSGYKITPKGMLQIFANQEVPIDILKQIFLETLDE